MNAAFPLVLLLAAIPALGQTHSRATESADIEAPTEALAAAAAAAAEEAATGFRLCFGVAPPQIVFRVADASPQVGSGSAGPSLARSAGRAFLASYLDGLESNERKRAAPAWFEEGVSRFCEPWDAQQPLVREFRERMGDRIPLADLLAVKTKPSATESLFAAESLTLVQAFVSQAGPRALRAMADGLSLGQSLTEVFAAIPDAPKDLATIESFWLEWVEGGGNGVSNQESDPAFDTSVLRPACVDRHPKVLFDDGHFNFHRSDGRYAPLATLLRNDGFAIVSNKRSFDAGSLAGADVLVIANARAEKSPRKEKAADSSAFTDAECEAVASWVRSGGSLLLIADHAPMGGAAASIAARFGVGMSGSYAIDPDFRDRSCSDTGSILFSRENGLLADHPATRGRDATESVARVVTFTGQSLSGPESSVRLLALSPSATDTTDASRIEYPSEGKGNAAGRAQGLAFDFEKGRVVVLGEAGMLSAQIEPGERKGKEGREPIRTGMNCPGNDNRQFALNAVRWLARRIE